jgi:iron complex outermembrane recepter protein
LIEAPGRPRRARPAVALLALSLAWGRLLASDPGEATEPPRDLTALTLAELGRIEVGAVSRREEPKGQAAAAVHVLTSDDLARAGVTALADALTLVPGVTVARADSSGWATGIRGFTSRLARSQLVLIDGRSVYDSLFAGTYWEVQDAVLDDLERIEVVRGPGGTLWGANAVNGIVSVVTKPASQTRGGLVALGGGNEELFGTLRYGGALGGRGAYRVYVKSFTRDATWHADGSTYDDWRLTQGGFRTDFDLPRDSRLTVQGDVYGGRAGQRSRVTSYTLPYLRDVERDTSLGGGNVLARWERGALRLQGYFDRTDRQETRFGEVRNTFDLDLQHRLGRFGRHDLVWGAGYRRSTGDSTGTETVSVLPPYRADDLVTGFVQDEVRLAGEAVRVAVGAKFEHNTYSGFEVQPSVRASWSPAAGQTLWAAATRAVRTPSRIEHDIDVTIGTGPATPVFLRWFGNPDFASETLRALEVGYRTDVGRWMSLDVAAFHNRYDGLLALAPGSASVEPGRIVLSVVTENGLEATSAGFETSVTFRPGAQWLVLGSYSFLSLDLEPIPGARSLTTGTNEEGSSPRHQLRVQAAVDLPADLQLSGALRWVDDLPAQGVKSYAELNARLAWRPAAAVELALVGRNLLHARHLEFVGDAPTPSEVERALVATLRLAW